MAGAADNLRCEQQALSRARDGRLAALLDSGEAGPLYLVLAWVEGASLRQVLAQRRQLPE